LQAGGQGNLNNLGGLYARNAEAYPAPVSGAAFNTPQKQRAYKRNIKSKQQIPFVCKEVNVDKRKKEK
jgi:hypothetical protein